jgi:hypothetical protein
MIENKKFKIIWLYFCLKLPYLKLSVTTGIIWMTCKSALSTVSRDVRLLPIIEQVANVVLCLSVHSRLALLFE